jgi:magnesium chelatase accessory protein
MMLVLPMVRSRPAPKTALSKTALSWAEDGRDWPNRAASRFVEAGGLRWHVQCLGEGPPLLLLHGTGAATHSWRALAPLLAKRFRVIAPDLPGHGFTDAMDDRNLSLPGIARAVGALLSALDVKPAIVAGHSAGVAILARLCIDHVIAPKLLISLNGALLPFEGMAGHVFPPMAKLLFLNPLVPRVFAWSADRLAVSQLLRWTGSSIDREGLDLYARLLGNPGHVAGALGMMAGWKLDELASDLPKLSTPVVLVAAQGDKAVSPALAEKLKAQLPNARVESLRGLGHLAHEERPDLVASLILRLASDEAVF